MPELPQDAGDGRDAVEAALAELRSCGWVGECAIRESAFSALSRWRGAAALAGLRAFVAAAADGLPPRLWSDAVITSCLRSKQQLADSAGGGTATASALPPLRPPRWLRAAPGEEGDVDAMLPRHAARARLGLRRPPGGGWLQGGAAAA